MALFRTLYIFQVAGMTNEDRLKLAQVGLAALIDEATGYQKVRPKDALAKLSGGFALTQEHLDEAEIDEQMQLDFWIDTKGTGKKQ